MKFILSVCAFALLTPVFAEKPTVNEIVDRARATVGSEAALDNLVTLQLTGGIVRAGQHQPDANIFIVARKPCSQRLEVRMGDLVETTIMEAGQGCIIRTNLDAEASRMRRLTDEELERVALSTRQFFSFFRPHFKKGERIRYEGVEQRRGVRSHKLVYTYPDGVSTTRYFSVIDDTLVSTVSDKGVETVEVGEQVVEGIKFPERIESYEGDSMLHSLVLADIQVNKPLKSGIFDIPKGEQK